MPSRRQATVSGEGRLAWLRRRSAEVVQRWARARAAERRDHREAAAVAVRVVSLLRRADRATKYQAHAVTGLHLTGISTLVDRGLYADALNAVDGVLDDCAALGRSDCEAASRAHGERARCFARLERTDESIDEFAASLRGPAPTSRPAAPWRLSLLYSLALTRRDLGDLDASTNELRALVPQMAGVFGEQSSWWLSTVTELAANVAAEGDVPTAVAMATDLLPGASYHLGPLSREALTLRSKIARWTLAEGDDAVRGRRLASTTLIDFTRAGLSTCAEAFELRFVYADALFEVGDVDYGIAQLSSLLDDLRESRWAASPFTDAVVAELEEWQDARRTGTDGD